MADMIQDPYAGADSDEEQQVIYQSLLREHEEGVREYDRKKQIYDDYSSQWDDQRSIQLSLEERFHKNVVYLSAGAFGVSFAFINQVIPLKEAVQTNILILSWFFFGLSLILAVLDPFIGSLIQNKFLSDIEKNIERSYAGESVKASAKWPIVISWLPSWLVVLSFSSGVLCLIYFVFINMAKG